MHLRQKCGILWQMKAITVLLSYCVSSALKYNGCRLKVKSLEKGGEKMYLPREEGQGLVEYALILVLVAIVVIAILALLGPQIANIFSKVTSGLTGT